MKPLFSLITPVYNTERYLPKCIESMLSQSYSNIEIILIDDGSTDNSGIVCDNAAKKDSRITVIHKKNEGIVSARVAGGQIANGEYIINVDSDDWIDRDYCKTMESIVKQYHPDIICCGYNLAYESKNVPLILGYDSGFYSKYDIIEKILPTILYSEHSKGFPLSLWAKATLRVLQQKYQITDNRVTIGEDIACMCSCIYNANSLYITREQLYYYRQNPDSITKSDTVYNWDSPEIRGKHLESCLIDRDAEIQNQIYCSVVHSLFNVVKSQFNRCDAKYMQIKMDIIIHLKNEYYKKAIYNAQFKTVRAKVMQALLKYKMICIIRLYKHIIEYF